MDRNTAIVAVSGMAGAVVIALAVLLIQPPAAAPAPQTCAQQGGSFCTAAQECPGAWLEASDTDRCCSMSCLVQDQPTVIQTGAAGEEALRNPFLWRIEGDPPSYLYGTIHIPDDRVLAFPQLMGDAFEAADEFYAEIELDAETQNVVAEAALLPPGQHLSDLVPADLYQRASDLVGTRGYSMSMFESYKVWAFTAMLEQLDYIQDALTKKPPDMYLYAAAEALGKTVGGIETAQEQMGIFEGLALPEQLEYLEVSLDIQETYREEGRDPTQEALEAYLSGNGSALLEKQSEETGVESEFLDAFLKRVGEDRNILIADRIGAMLVDKPDRSLFIATGVMHLVGEGSVIDLLEGEGFTVNRMTPSTAEEAEAWDLPPAAEAAFESAWCPAGLETGYDIPGMGYVPVKIHGLEFYKGRQMCHFEASFDLGYGEPTPVDIWVDENGEWEVDMSDVTGGD